MRSPLLLVLSFAVTSSAVAGDPSTDGIGYVVVAEDRGWLGNEEVGDAFDRFVHEEGASARLVVVTDDRTGARVRAAIDDLVEDGAQRIVGLPLFLSDDDPTLSFVRGVVEAEAKDGPELVWARPFGESYYAVEALAADFRDIHDAERRSVVVLGHGATDPGNRAAMEEDLQRIADRAAVGFDFREVRAMVWYDDDATDADTREREVRRDLIRAMALPGRDALVTYQLGPKLDSMMSMSAYAQSHLPPGVAFVDGDLARRDALATWMAREARRHGGLGWQDVGVVFLAHGSDYEWNVTMQAAAARLAERVPVEFAFSMADPPVVERAVRRLEERGARAVVVVRVFGMESSFERDVQRMFGLDVESPTPTTSGPVRPTAAAGGHGHGSSGPAPRILTAAPVATVGGVEAHPRFAEALLDRAHAVSSDPPNETVILVAHGSGSDRVNDHWRSVLEQLATTMREQGGSEFRDIRTGTWREDWPEQREPEIAAIRAMVEEGTANGGRVIVIPARTTGTGSEAELLAGLQYSLGEGFAPSEPFERWLDEQVAKGAAQLGIDTPAETADASGDEPAR